MDIHNLKIGDIILSSNGFMKDKNYYGKIIAIFSDGLLFFDRINGDNEFNDEYEEVFDKDVSEILISNESLIKIGFIKDGESYIKDTINGKGKVVISETESYIESYNTNVKTPIPFTLYSISKHNTIHMLQRKVREVLNDEVI